MSTPNTKYESLKEHEILELINEMKMAITDLKHDNVNVSLTTNRFDAKDYFFLEMQDRARSVMIIALELEILFLKKRYKEI